MSLILRDQQEAGFNFQDSVNQLWRFQDSKPFFFAPWERRLRNGLMLKDFRHKELIEILQTEKTPDEVVKRAYELILARPCDTAGYDYHIKIFESGGLSTLVKSLRNSQERHAKAKKIPYSRLPVLVVKKAVEKINVGFRRQ